MVKQFFTYEGVDYMTMPRGGAQNYMCNECILRSRCSRSGSDLSADHVQINVIGETCTVGEYYVILDPKTEKTNETKEEITMKTLTVTKTTNVKGTRLIEGDILVMHSNGEDATLIYDNDEVDESYSKTIIKGLKPEHLEVISLYTEDIKEL